MTKVSSDQIGKVGEAKKPTPTTKEVEKKKTISEIFLEECDEVEAAIFQEVKSTLINKCHKYEFEAVTDENLDAYATMINYIKNGIISIDESGVSIKLRKPLINKDNQVLTDTITILYERNEGRENAFRKSINVSQKSKQYNDEVALAVIAASFESVGNVMLGKESFSALKRDNYNDYLLILNTYTFFRS